MEVEPVNPASPPPEKSVPQELPVSDEETDTEVVSDDELGDNVDLMA